MNFVDVCFLFSEERGSEDDLREGVGYAGCFRAFLGKKSFHSWLVWLSVDFYLVSGRNMYKYWRTLELIILERNFSSLCARFTISQFHTLMSVLLIVAFAANIAHSCTTQHLP